MREIAFKPNSVGNQEIINFIEKTYKKVIFEDVLNNGMVFFGENSQYYSCVNDSIVIGIKYDEFNLHGLSDEEWDKLHDKQLDFLDFIVNKMTEELNTKNNDNLRVVKY